MAENSGYRGVFFFSIQDQCIIKKTVKKSKFHDLQLPLKFEGHSQGPVGQVFVIQLLAHQC